MPPLDEHGDAGVANTPGQVSPEPILEDSTVPDTVVSGDASVAALAAELEYTLTVGQAVEHFAAARRKPPSGRSIQRYCIEGRLAAQKIRTVYGSEWLINESSLMRLIEGEPIVFGVAGDAKATPPPPSIDAGTSVHISDTPVIGDAGVATHLAMTTPKGETRTLSEVLIENARFLAEVEGRDAIIIELKEDRSFLREEVREARRTRDDVKNIAERMLDTLKTIAIGRTALGGTPNEAIQATIVPKNTND